MIYVLFALIAALFWAICFILEWPFWIAGIATGVLALVAAVMFITRTLRARKAASALEDAIAKQGMQQAMNARPERRAEIQALQQQIQDGIKAIKQSRLGGKKGGGSALYSLPWYAIIGPPGAGKTTALKHSGLVFPYADTAVRGVGGTRNCDWWFTNEAILLDTAGRYATEHEDQAEWLAFLDMLLKYRGSKPLNGLIVAISVPDIIDANEQQLELMGKTLRARIDEVMTKLRMVLPVYLLVTKCDLVAGFSEFFGDLRKSQRAQAWGATFNLNEDKSDPAGLFQREFDLLVKEVHARSIKRLATERNRASRERIYHFPLEFSGIKRNLSDLISTVFMVNTFQGTPTFRGFYFTSGTQEGKPLDRVLQRMGAAMGIRNPQIAEQQSVESRSYFLHDMFMNVVFPDADVAARSSSEVRRQKMVRLAVSGVAFVLAIVLAIPSTRSFFINRSLLLETKEMAAAASEIDWSDGKPASKKVKALIPIYQRLIELQGYEKDLPLKMQWLMYHGDRIYRPLVRVFIDNMQKGFVLPNKFALESELNKGRAKEFYVEERRRLKTYLLLSEVGHLNDDCDPPLKLDLEWEKCHEWAAKEHTALWLKLQESTTDVALVDLKRDIEPMVKFYFELITPKDGDETPIAEPVPANQKIVDKTRERLLAGPVRDRYYAMFIGRLNYELYTPADGLTEANMKFPPITLRSMFTDKPDVLKYISSRQFKEQKKWKEVEGPYTTKGHDYVRQNLKEGQSLLEREQWVVPLTKEESGDQVVKNLADLTKDYEQRYIRSWQDFLYDISITTPATLQDAVDLYRVLRTAEWPYLRIIRTVEDNTQWKSSQLVNNETAGKIINRRINSKLTQKAHGLRFDVDIKKIAKTSLIPPKFSKTVLFGVPAQGSGGAATETPLAKYMEELGKLQRKIEEVLRDQPDANPAVVGIEVRRILKETEAALKTIDDQTATNGLLAMLQFPLNIGGKFERDLNPALALRR